MHGNRLREQHMLTAFSKAAPMPQDGGGCCDNECGCHVVPVVTAVSAGCGGAACECATEADA